MVTVSLMCSRFSRSRRKLLERRALIRRELLTQRRQVLGDALAACVLGDELAGAVAVLEEQGGQARYARRVLDCLHPLGHDARRYVDAVQDVADVVQHVGGDFSHACLARRRHQLFVHPLELHLLRFRSVVSWITATAPSG